MADRRVLIFDNGAHSIKCGLFPSKEEPRIIPNAVVRLKGEKNKQFIGPEFDESLDYSIVHYRLPFERGYLTDWDVEKAVWDRILFGKNGFKIDPHEHAFLVTEPNFNMHAIQETYDQMVFEEWEFASYYRCPPAALTPFSEIFGPYNELQPECAVIVDSGFSFTHVTPILQRQAPTVIHPADIQWSSVRRLDVGGKLLTNHLKQLVSFRHWDMTESTHIINQIKEACCFVSSDFGRDLEICRSSLKSPIAQSYVLPSFATEPPRPGYIATTNSTIDESDTLLPMNNERFVVPEVLFTPSDVGLAQVGLPQTIASSIESLPEEMRSIAWANIGLVGGNCLFAGFESRLYNELRALAPTEHEVRLYRAKNPLTSTFDAAYAFASSPWIFPQLCVTREEYLERGANACRKKFAPVNWYPDGGAARRDESSAGKKDEPGGARRERKVERKSSTAGRGRGRGRRKTIVMPAEEVPGTSAEVVAGPNGVGLEVAVEMVAPEAGMETSTVNEAEGTPMDVDPKP